MHSFLQKTVDRLVEKYPEQISELCIVLPNRRAGLFLKNHFANKLQQTFWSPEIYATEDFVSLLSGLQAAEPATLLFELYETVKTVDPQRNESFDDFSKWGQVFLSDLNELDRYLVDPDVLFGNLREIKELETWSLNTEPLTEFQQQYLQFWNSLGLFYSDYTKRLLEKKLAYQGLSYRIVAQDPVARAKKHNWKRIIFAGFNALNKAEELIIEQLLLAGLAEVIWDTDAYYLDQPHQEAGKFIRKYEREGKFKKNPELHTLIKEELLSKGEKRIHLIGAAKNVAQAKVAGNMVRSLRESDEKLQNTALVLADENLLFPVLHSLPEDIQDVNVTMGYPLKNTPVSGYFDLIFNMHEIGLKSAKGKSSYSFYHRDLLKLLSYPYSATAIGNESVSVLLSIVQKIRKSNIVFAAPSTLEKRLFGKEQAHVFEAFRPLFVNWSGPVDALNALRNLIDTLRQRIVERQGAEQAGKANLELEYLFAFTKIIKRIQALMDNYPESIDSVKTLRSVFNQLVRSTTLPFYGEPLMGLQVMGMLETRTLDFKNVILLSCNENILPSGKSGNSFIPFELKRYFGMPTYGDKDAIFAYHFYRLLQRAETIYLVYNTEGDALGGGEVSRFITQLEHELPRYNENIKMTRQLVTIPVQSDSLSNGIIIEKDAELMEKIQAKLAYGLSPSALNKFRNCSLEFYLNALVGLKEADEVEEVIGADVLGNAIHEVLEQLYTPHVGKVLNVQDIKNMMPLVDQLIYESLTKQYDQGDISFGKNLLTLKVAQKFIHNFLKEEMQQVEESLSENEHLSILALEAELETEMSYRGTTVKFKGKSDRVDRIGNLLRIVDYKTGLAADKELQLSDLSDLVSGKEKDKSFQLLMYAWLYSKMHQEASYPMISGIITFRQLSAGLKPVLLNKKSELNKENLIDFEQVLLQLVDQLLDPSVPFSQTSDAANCAYCSFKGICNR